MSELQDLKGTWQELSKVHTNLTELKYTPWAGLVPKKMRTALSVRTIYFRWTLWNPAHCCTCFITHVRI